MEHNDERNRVAENEIEFRTRATRGSVCNGLLFRHLLLRLDFGKPERAFNHAVRIDCRQIFRKLVDQLIVHITIEERVFAIEFTCGVDEFAKGKK